MPFEKQNSCCTGGFWSQMDRLIPWETKQFQRGFLFKLFYYFMLTGILSTVPNNSLGTEKPGHLDKQRTLWNSHYVPECSMKLLSLDSYTTAQLFTPMLAYKSVLWLIWSAANPASASASKNPSFKVSPSFASLLCLFTTDNLRFSEPKWDCCIFLCDYILEELIYIQ